MKENIIWTPASLRELNPNLVFCNLDNRKLCEKTGQCSNIRQSGTIWFRHSTDEILSRLSGKTEEKILEERMNRLGERDYKKCRKVLVYFKEVKNELS